MHRALTLALVTSLMGTAALAQSQIAISVSRDLRRAGVSEACIARLSTHDFALLKGIRDARNKSPGNKRTQMAFKARQACGETRSVLSNVFGQPDSP